MKSLIISTLVLASLFVGCKSSGGICCDAEGEEQPYVEPLLAPVAVMDNRTDENYYYFSCENSYDRDENNQSIVRCDWIVTRSGEGIEITTEDFNGTNEINVSKYFDTMTGNIVNIELIVIDDENQTDTAEKNISILY